MSDPSPVAPDERAAAQNEGLFPGAARRRGWFWRRGAKSTAWIARNSLSKETANDATPTVVTVKPNRTIWARN